jgi:hypothetical protein
MKFVLILSVAFIFGCQEPPTESYIDSKFKGFVPNAIINSKIYFNLKEANRVLTLSRQLGLPDIIFGTKGFEARIWENSAFSEYQTLTIFKLFDTACSITESKIYLKDPFLRISKNGYSRRPFPIVDSSRATVKYLDKPSILKTFASIQNMSAWEMPSQYELSDFEKMGGTDGTWYTLEIADSSRYRILLYDNPRGTYSALKDKTNGEFLELVYRIMDFKN